MALANEQNLRPRNLTSEEAARIGRLGGIASGESRRQKKLLQEYADLYLSLPADKRKLKGKDIPEDMLDNKMLIIKALHDKACSGDVAAAKELRSIIGEDVPALPGSTSEDDNLFEAIRAAVVDHEV